MNKNLGQQIILLHKEGKSYSEIQLELKCSKGLISYHLGYGQKQKTAKRQKINRAKAHPYKSKIFTFSSGTNYSIKKTKVTSINKQFQNKLWTFHMSRKIQKYNKPTFSVQDVVDKFGDKPKCYLTGKEIDIHQPSTYEFDHIIPASKGGQNTLDNLGITTKEANQAKRDLSVDDFIQLCKDILVNQGYKISK